MAAAAQRDINDHYAREAKRQGYVARSAFKLMEIQEKRKVIARGARVLDLGCAPGAWLQVACQHLGPPKSGGIVIGIDLKPVKVPPKHCDQRVVAIQGDALAMDVASIVREAMTQQRTVGGGGSAPPGPAPVEEGAGPDTARREGKAGEDASAPATPIEPFDVVLSDMMASTAGHQATDHFRSVELARRALHLAVQALRPGGNFVVKVFEGESYSDFLSECRAHFEQVKGFSPKSSRSESREMFVICERFRAR